MAYLPDFNERAKRFLSRSRGDHGHKQTLQFIGEIYRIEYQLIEIENQLASITPRIYSSELKSIEKGLAEVSEHAYRLQRAITAPEDHLHELLEIQPEDVDQGAIAEILTQLGWEWLPRELDRVYTVQDRVYRKADAKRQQLLTNRIILFSVLAVLLSVVALVL